MSGRVARGLRKLSGGSRMKYKFAKSVMKRNHWTYAEVRESLEAKDDSTTR